MKLYEIIVQEWDNKHGQRIFTGYTVLAEAKNAAVTYSKTLETDTRKVFKVRALTPAKNNTGVTLVDVYHYPEYWRVTSFDSALVDSNARNQTAFNERDKTDRTHKHDNPSRKYAGGKKAELNRIKAQYEELINTSKQQ